MDCTKKKHFKIKSLTVCVMCGIVMSLYAGSYLLFLRVVEVDVTKDASIIYRGESGSGSVKVKNKMRVYNQRLQQFMDSITYHVEPSTNLSNGDIITIEASYDEELARRFNVSPIMRKRTVKVQSLATRYEQGSQLPQEFVTHIEETGLDYIKSHEQTIIKESFSNLDKGKQIIIEDQVLNYRIFLKAKQFENKDKVIDIYQIRAKGIEREKEEVSMRSKEQEQIDYMVIFNDINSSNTLSKENVYGEKIIVPQSYDISTKEGFQAFLNDKYASQYEIEFLYQCEEQNKEITEENQK